MNRLAWIALVILLFPLAARAAERPNVLFLFADDLCWEAVRAFRQTDIETPNLDRLAREGTTFTRAYNMGSWSGAVCVASRTMLNTGRFLWNAHAIYADSEKERQAGRFWSEHLERAGYETYMTGKWHVRAKAEKAFHIARHVRPGMPNQTAAGYNRPLPGQPDPWSPYDPKFGGFWKGGRHWSEVVADDALDYLKRAVGRNAPFFMYIAFNAAHDPRQSPKEYVDRYPLKRIKVPRNWLAEYPYKDAIGCGKKLRDERLGPFPRTEHAIKVHRQEYYALITHLDTQIGRILGGLEKSGKAARTWIVFTADHGLAVGHHGLFGKQNMYDHSVRVPFIVKAPGVAAGARIDTPIYLQDIMPTTLELAGLEKPAHVEFKSLLPLLRGENVVPYPSIYGAYLGVQRMVTKDGWKLIVYPKAKRTRLYDLREDPLEMTDLAESAEHATRVRDLFRELLALQRRTGDTLDLPSVFPSLR